MHPFITIYFIRNIKVVANQYSPIEIKVLVLTNAITATIIIIIIIDIIIIDFIEIIIVEDIIVIMAVTEIKGFVKIIPNLRIISIINIMVRFEEIAMQLIKLDIKAIMAEIDFDKLVPVFRSIMEIMVGMEILVVVRVLRGKLRVFDLVAECLGITI